MNAPKLPAPLETAPTIGEWFAVDPDGRITILTGRVELGQGSLTALRQIAADELNCAPEHLEIHAADTGATPDEGFTAGSVTIPLGGAAVRWAASALRQAVIEAAAARLGADTGAREAEAARRTLEPGAGRRRADGPARTHGRRALRA